jgi:hypothetical protein
MKWLLKNTPDTNADEYFYKRQYEKTVVLTDPYHPMSCTLLK